MAKDPDLEAPEDLPSIEESSKPATNVLEASKTCGQCGSDNIRIIANYDGRRAICGSCKNSWSLGLYAPTILPGGATSRGFSKHTYAEPDWNVAFEDFDDVYDPSKDPRK